MTRRLIALVTVLLLSVCLSGCETMRYHWDELEPAEKVGVAIIGGAGLAAIVIRNGQGNSQSQNQCISTRSLETGCWPP